MKIRIDAKHMEGTMTFHRGQCMLQIWKGRELTNRLADEIDRMTPLYVDGTEFQRGSSAIHFTMQKGTAFKKAADLVALAVRLTTGDLAAKAKIERVKKRSEAG